MPQIEQLAATYASQIFWLLVFFGLTFLVVGKGMVPRVMATVADRDQRIAADLAAARAARDTADAEESAWRARENDNRVAAQGIVAAAKADSAAAAQARLAETQAGLDRQLAEAETRIAAARAAALAELETVAADAAQDIVARVAGITVPAPAAHTAVKEVMSHG